MSYVIAYFMDGGKYWVQYFRGKYRLSGLINNATQYKEHKSALKAATEAAKQIKKSTLELKVEKI